MKPTQKRQSCICDIYIRYATARLDFSGRSLPEAKNQKCKQG